MSDPGDDREVGDLVERVLRFVMALSGEGFSNQRIQMVLLLNAYRLTTDDLEGADREKKRLEFKNLVACLLNDLDEES